MPDGPALDPYAVLQVVPTCEQEVLSGAYKALARKYHPDRDPSRRAADKMAQLNRAFELVRDERARSAYDRSRRTIIAGISVRTTPRGGSPLPSRSIEPGSVLTFGRYAGWGLRDLARHDPDYLLWLSRHSSGIRYRTEIYGILRTLGVSAA
ncbi:MAG TPA: DnaJ domain-containing protein [Candidatus Limnocylindria bacterium]|nr:DnaJ domain-containing protein [Candidatus Limnocylindria bacterium]